MGTPEGLCTACGTKPNDFTWHARRAYVIADAMIAERAK
jgi:hypothetical protein